MSLQRFLPYVLILSLVLAAISCNDEWLGAEYDTTIQWEGGFEGPLIFGSLNLKDLLTDYDKSNYIEENDSGLLYVSYSIDTVLLAPAMLEIPDQEFIQMYFRFEAVPGAAIDLIPMPIEQPKEYKFELPGDARIDSVNIKAGEMRIRVMSSIRHEGTLTISSDDVFIKGKKYEKVVSISNASGTFDETVSIDMAGGSIRFNNDVPDSTSIALMFALTLINSGNDILETDEVQIVNSFHDLEFTAAYGYLGAYDSLLIEKSELEFDLLARDFFTGSAKLANPQLTIRTDNSMGLPIEIELADMEARFKNKPATAITILPSNTISISSPDRNDIGGSAKDTTVIDTTTSNLHVAATTDLVGFQYSVRVKGNPDPNGPKDNFILEDSKLGVQVEGLVNFNLRIDDVVLVDTSDFNIGSEYNVDNIEYVKIQLSTKNMLPVDMGLQIYFIDSIQNWLKLDSLFGEDKSILLSGVPLINGFPAAHGHVNEENTPWDTTSIVLTTSQMEHALDANKLLLKAYVETYDGGNKDVKFFSDYSLSFKLGTRIKAKLSNE
ncbi:hypothetical protein ACFLTU_06975 [Bacteroidota bacterium]